MFWATVLAYSSKFFNRCAVPPSVLCIWSQCSLLLASKMALPAFTMFCKIQTHSVFQGKILDFWETLEVWIWAKRRHNECGFKTHPYLKTMYHDKYVHVARCALNVGVFILMTSVCVIYTNPLNLKAKSSQFWAARAQVQKRPIENCP